MIIKQEEKRTKDIVNKEREWMEEKGGENGSE